MTIEKTSSLNEDLVEIVKYYKQWADEDLTVFVDRLDKIESNVFNEDRVSRKLENFKDDTKYKYTKVLKELAILRADVNKLMGKNEHP